jgi:hypothetical protein
LAIPGLRFGLVFCDPLLAIRVGVAATKREKTSKRRKNKVLLDF